MTIRELLKYGEQQAKLHGKEESAVKRLLMHFLHKEGYELIMSMNESVSVDEESQFKAGVHHYVDLNIPVQHIIGYEYFYGYPFIVGPDVLIPRQETEELVANVLASYDEFFDGKEVDVVDVGTGSGAIAITLALEEPKMHVDATDISNEALEVARKNCTTLEANVTFITGDMLQPLIESGKKYDILVSNPPYIPDEEYVEGLVKDNEPHVALFGGEDGMRFYEIILRDAHSILNKHSMIAFEHGWNQLERMEKLIQRFYPNSRYEMLKDLNGKDRMTIIYNE